MMSQLRTDNLRRYAADWESSARRWTMPLALAILSVAIALGVVANQLVVVAALLLGAALVAMVLVSPIIGVAMSAFALPLSYPSHLAGFGSRTLFEVVLGLTVVAMVASRLRPMRATADNVAKRWPAVVPWVFAWSGLILIEFLRNPQFDFDESVLHSTGKVLFRVVVSVLLFAVIVAASTTRRRLTGVVWGFALGAIVPMAWGVLLGFSHTFVAGYNGGLISESVAYAEGAVWRVGSTFNSPFGFSLESSLVFLLAVTYLVLGKRLRWRIAAAGLAVLAAVAVQTSQVRAGGIGVVAGLLVLAALSPRHGRWLLVGAGLSAVALTAIAVTDGGVDLGRLLNLGDRSTQTRLALWQFSLSLFVRSPVVGGGLSSFELLYERLYSSPYEIGVVSAHSTIFSVAVELGSLGLILVIGQAVSVLRQALKNWSEARGDWLSVWLVSGLAVALPFVVTEDIYIQRDLVYLVYLLMGMVVAYGRLQQNRRKGPAKLKVLSASRLAGSPDSRP